MAKKSSKKKSAAPDDVELSKKDRKALKKREAVLAATLDVRTMKDKKLSKLYADKSAGKVRRQAARAELERRAGVEAANRGPIEEKHEKPAKKGKPGKDAAIGYVESVGEILKDVEKRQKKSAKSKVADAADKVLAEGGAPDAMVAAKTAKAAAAEADPEETDEQIKARVKAKRERREVMMSDEYRAGVDLADHEAVLAYNDELAHLGGHAALLTSNATKAQLKKSLAEGKVSAKVKKADPSDDTADDGEAANEADEPKPAKKGKKAAAQLVEPVETETGTIYAAGEAEEADAADGIAKPSEAERVDFEVNGNHQYLVKRPSDGKLVGYTRTTTYIDALDDKTRLNAWKMRTLLEGLTLNETDPDTDAVIPRIADLVHRRDVAIAKARKADRKGKLKVGELSTIVEAAKREYKKAVDEIVEAMVDLGGIHEKATKGTNLHALFQLYDEKGLDAVGDLLTEGKITPADLADVEARARVVEELGLKMIPECRERVIVNDELAVAGRMDAAAMYRFPGTGRAVRCVVDDKTGSTLEYGVGKLAQQLEMYAGAKGYNLDTHEREDLKLSRTKGIVIHTPQGTGTSFAYEVDLATGRVGNKLAGEVRAFRNTGKKAVNLKPGADLVALTKASRVGDE